MTGLQEAFYIVALIYMGISLLLIISLLAAVVIIRKKVIDLEKTVTEKIDFLVSIPAKVESIIDGIRHLTKHDAK
ncbi:MAG TPA: hypothetical protein VLF59_01130 [Candidatus Saccharimonadales bacterium]|nr:hypothetical protein [Candidatus Saccharimonadales bacterium]